MNSPDKIFGTTISGLDGKVAVTDEKALQSDLTYRLGRSAVFVE